ncbi:MAG: YigZ family protein [Malacoplasma sp.]|nr:YigZ family protein [Malacoplasma sp.]
MSFTIKEKASFTLKISNSKFIGVIYPYKNNFDEIKKDIKTEYTGAKHYCYAYVYDNAYKFSDDKEPEGTAGKPILNALTNDKLNRVCLFIVRYFGGTKLGKANLLKAYRDCAMETVKTVKKYEIVNAFVYKLELGYKEFDQLKKMSTKYDFELDEVNYDEKIKLNLLSKNKLDKNFFVLLKDVKILKESKKEMLIIAKD